jgi:hypothetical protein
VNGGQSNIQSIRSLQLYLAKITNLLGTIANSGSTPSASIPMASRNQKDGRGIVGVQELLSGMFVENSSAVEDAPFLLVEIQRAMSS